MSQHIVESDRFKYVFGWDQPLQSFYLQQHDIQLEDPDNNPIIWLGPPTTRMYEVEDLVRQARPLGLDIPHETQVKLYGEKDDGV